MKASLAVLLLLIAAPSPSQEPDSSLCSLISSLLRSELRGGGWRDTLVWQPADSISAAVLARLNFGTADKLISAEGRVLDCPGSSTAEGLTLPQPVGYTARAWLYYRTSDSAIVALSVSCRYIYRGRPSGFMETASWAVAKGSNGWRVVRLLNRGIT